ncbi:MAG: ABC transporter permease [Thermomicrobium sp.]|nr:ABC transporter permease [Thermomicrobium sp.]
MQILLGIGRRFLLGALSLWGITVVIFALTNVLPGDVGRRILGPFADERAVAALNRQLGTDRPLPEQYVRWLGRVLRGDLGESLALRRPVAELLWPAVGNSLKLAALILLVSVPAGIGFGLAAAVQRERWFDRAFRVASVVTTVLPEFVTGIFVILLLGIWIPLFPVSAVIPAGSDAWEQLRRLVLPALPIVFILAGYLGRVMRASAGQALEAAFVRAAYLRGVPAWLVMARHVIPAAVPPVIAVTANQLGYLLGGLVAIEALFNYPGLGSLLLTAARQKDFPVLQAGALVIGATYYLANLSGDYLFRQLDPRQQRSSGR